MSHRDSILRALHSRYVAQRNEALTDLEVYLDNPVGVGEHPEIVDAAASRFEKYEAAESRLELLEKVFPELGICEE